MKVQKGVLQWSLLYSFICLIDKSCSKHTQDICQRDNPETAKDKTPGDNGFRIKIAGIPEPKLYQAQKVYTVALNGTFPMQRLRGFMLVAVPRFAHDESTSMGTFQHFNSLTGFVPQCPHVVSMQYQVSLAGIEVLWTAPPSGAGCVELRATVIEKSDRWFKDDGALTKVLCEETDLNTPEMQPILLQFP